MLARYKIVHELGRGATGAVYAARDRTTGALVALKRLDPALLQSDPNAAVRFLNQARAARRLRHPNIVETYDAGEAAGTAYVAMELLEGENLRKVLDDGPLPVARALRIAHQVASGLAYAHLEGAVHGGITPTNILVLRSGGVKITDFGTAQAGPAAAPEQLRGEPLDHRCDIFSLGALFYEMLTHRRPVDGAPPPSELNPHVPRALDALVLSMLAPQPAARMPGIPILLRELERLEEGLGVAPVAAAAPEEPTARVPPSPPRPEVRPEPGPRLRTPDPRDMLEHHMAIMERRESAPQRPARSRPIVFATLGAVLAALVIGLADFMGSTGFMRLAGLSVHLRSLIDRGTVASRAPEMPPVATATPRPAAPLPPVAEAPKEEAAKEVVREVEVRTPKVQPPSPPDTAADAKTDPAPATIPPAADPMPLAAPVAQLPPALPPAPRPPPPAAKAPAKESERTARLILAVSPRGELYINGEHQGATPPITTLDLAPGMHRVEVRSGSRKPFLTYMTVEPGDVRRIRHDFNAKPIRPPG